MAQTISLDNFNGNILSQVKLTADAPAGSNSLSVQNSVNFASAEFMLIGNPGAPGCEIMSAVSPIDAVTVGTANPTLLPHNNGDQLSLLFGASINIYRATDQYGTGQQPDDDQFSNIDTVTIDPTQQNTEYTDSSPGSFWYKYTFLNQNTASETQLSDSIANQAGQTHYVSLSQIRDAAGFSDAPQVTDSKISAFRDAAEREVNGAMASIINLPFTLPINPIIVQITKNIAAGELMQDEYNTISPTIAMGGASKSKQARAGGGGYTSLSELTSRTVVLQDANYTDITSPDAPGFIGYPNGSGHARGEHDERGQFRMNEEY